MLKLYNGRLFSAYLKQFCRHVFLHRLCKKRTKKKKKKKRQALSDSFASSQQTVLVHTEHVRHPVKYATVLQMSCRLSACTLENCWASSVPERGEENKSNSGRKAMEDQEESNWELILRIPVCC